MAVYVGDSKNSSAALTALKINYAMQEIVVPAMRSVYTQTTYVPKHVVGIDTSDLLIARTGVRGANDLVWVGRSANYAAKLAALPEQYATYVTTDVFDRLRDDVKRSNSGQGESMWTALTWNSCGGRQIYGSRWQWRVD
jgi:class 3 adenylate cyclase